MVSDKKTQSRVTASVSPQSFSKGRYPGKKSVQRKKVQENLANTNAHFKLSYNIPAK